MKRVIPDILVEQLLLDELDSATREVVDTIAAGPPVALSMTKRALDNASASSLAQALEERLVEGAADTGAARAGLAACWGPPCRRGAGSRRRAIPPPIGRREPQPGHVRVRGHHRRVDRVPELSARQSRSVVHRLHLHRGRA